MFHCVSMIHMDENNSGRRCARVRGVSLRMFSAGRISLMLTGCSICVGGSVDYSDWPREDCAVDLSPGEIRIGYIRQGLWTDSLIDAAPVTGSLIDSALSDCLIVLCTAGFSSTWTFCSTDFVVLAGFVLSVRRVDDFGIMAADSAALAEVRAGITFGVELNVRGMLRRRWWMFHRRVLCPWGTFRMSSDLLVVVRGSGKSCASGPGRSQCASPGSGLSGSGPELSRRYHCRYGGGAGVGGFHSGVVGPQSTMAPCRSPSIPADVAGSRPTDRSAPLMSIETGSNGGGGGTIEHHCPRRSQQILNREFEWRQQPAPPRAVVFFADEHVSSF